MRVALIQAPVVEPVSLADAKLYLRVDTSDEDTLIGTLIAAARHCVEAATARQLIDQVWRSARKGASQQA